MKQGVARGESPLCQDSELYRWKVLPWQVGSPSSFMTLKLEAGVCNMGSMDSFNVHSAFSWALDGWKNLIGTGKLRDFCKLGDNYIFWRHPQRMIFIHFCPISFRLGCLRKYLLQKINIYVNKNLFKLLIFLFILNGQNGFSVVFVYQLSHS